MHWPVYFEGMALGAGLIIAIGAQNAFVLRQGLARRHVFLTALICTLCDVILISLGVGGLGAVIQAAPALLIALTWGGAIFLLYYGLRAFQRAGRSIGMDTQTYAAQEAGSLRTTVLSVLGFSLLNPHVYLDTVILLGSLGGRHPAAERLSFVSGAATASLIWFFGLAYGAGLLTPLFRRPATWRVLDVSIGCIMLVLAARLLLGL